MLEKLRKIYHYIILDCPPTLNILTINALVAADEVVIPAGEYFALEGLAKLLNHRCIAQTLSAGVEIHAVLRTMTMVATYSPGRSQSGCYRVFTRFSDGYSEKYSLSRGAQPRYAYFGI